MPRKKSAEKCWKNPANQGKGRTNKERGEKGKKNPAPSSSKGKGKARANVAEQESSSDGELEKSFTTFVNISDEGEMSKASQADLSAYSRIIDSGVTMHICANLEAFVRISIPYLVVTAYLSVATSHHSYL